MKKVILIGLMLSLLSACGPVPVLGTSVPFYEACGALMQETKDTLGNPEKVGMFGEVLTYTYPGQLIVFYVDNGVCVKEVHAQ